MAAVTARGILINLGANVVQFKRDMDEASTHTEKTVGRITSQIGTMKAAFAGIGAGLAFGRIISEASQAEASVAQLNATLASTKGAVGISAKQLQDYAEALKKVSIYDDDAIVGAEALLATFTKIKGDTFKQATKATVDLASKMGIDLKQAALQVGKALQDPISGINSLHRAGVSFTEGQKNTIKALVTGGQAAKAQALILRELTTEFGGSAEAARNTVGGAFEAMKISIDNVFEAIGTSSSTGLQAAFNSVTAVMDEVGSHGKELSNALLGIAAAAAIIKAAQLPALFSSIAGTLGKAVLAMGPQGWILAGVAAATGALITFKDTAFDVGDKTITMQNLVIAAWERISRGIGQAITSIKPWFDGFVKSAFEAGANAGKFLVDNFNKYLKPLLTTLVNFGANIPFMKPVVENAKKAMTAIQQMGNGIQKEFQGIITRAAELTKATTAKSPALGGGLADDDEGAVDKKAKKNADTWAKFIQSQRESNKELAVELNNHKELVPYLKAQAQIEAQIGTLSKAQAAALKEQFDLRMKLTAGIELKNEVDMLARTHEELSLQLQDRKEEIPYLQFINNLKAKGIEVDKLTITQRAQLREIEAGLMQTEKDRLQMQTKAAIDSLKEQNEAARDRIEAGKDNAEILGAIRNALKQNKFINDADLDTIKQQVRLRQEQAKTEALMADMKGSQQQLDTLKKQVELHGLIRSGNQEEYDYQMKVFEIQQKTEKVLSQEQKDLVKNLVHYQNITREMAKADSYMDSIKTDNEKWAEKVKEVNELIASGLLNVTPQQAQKIYQNLSPAFAKIKQAAQDIGSAFEKAFTDAIFSGGKLSDVLKNLAKDVAAIAVKNLITQPIGNAITRMIQQLLGQGVPLTPPGGPIPFPIPFPQPTPAQPGQNTGATPGGWLSGIGGFFGNLFGGAGKLFGGAFNGIKKLLGFAQGGRPPWGQASLVGENGPELFVPDGAGTIIPNDFLSAYMSGDDFEYQQSMFMSPMLMALMGGMFGGGGPPTPEPGSWASASAVDGGFFADPNREPSYAEKAHLFSRMGRENADRAREQGLWLQAALNEQNMLGGWRAWDAWGGQVPSGTQAKIGQAPQIGNDAHDFMGMFQRDPGFLKKWGTDPIVSNIANWANRASGGIGRNSYSVLSNVQNSGWMGSAGDNAQNPMLDGTQDFSVGGIPALMSRLGADAHFGNSSRPTAFNRDWFGDPSARFKPLSELTSTTNDWVGANLGGSINGKSYSGLTSMMPIRSGFGSPYFGSDLNYSGYRNQGWGGKAIPGPFGTDDNFFPPFAPNFDPFYGEEPPFAPDFRKHSKGDLLGLGDIPSMADVKKAMKGGSQLRNKMYTLQNNPDLYDRFSPAYIKGLKMPASWGGFGLLNPEWASMPFEAFATGGRPKMNRPSLVGERGPELFVPDTAGRVIPNNALGGASTEIHNYSPFSVNQETVTNPDGSRALRFIIAEEMKHDMAAMGPILQTLIKHLGVQKRGLVR